MSTEIQSIGISDAVQTCDAAPWHSILLQVPVTVAVALISAILMTLPDISSILDFEANASFASRCSTVVSSHMVHWSIEHLFWDAMMFVALCGFCELRSKRWTYCCLVISAITIPFGALFFESSIGSYRGLSGLDTALFVLASVFWLAEAWSDKSIGMMIVVGGALAGLISKIGYEAISGKCLFVDVESAGFSPLVWAHVIGALIGALVGTLAIVSLSKELK